MPTRFDLIRRLEPRRPARDLNDGIAAPLADPLWLLGRQWQLGEHQAENAASPVRVRIRASSTPLEPPTTRPDSDPTTTPAEALVEGEPEDWWTPGRRIRLGRQAAPYLGGLHAELLARDLPPPYDVHNGSVYDGRLVYRQRVALGLPAALFAEVPTDKAHHWSASGLYYSTAFPCAGAQLEVAEHDGGDIDWWSVDADGTLAAPPPHDPVEIVPNRFRYPGAPHPRWWQIEDVATDPGGYPPDRGQFPTMLMVDLLSSPGNDWYLLPIDARMGSVVTLHEITAIDAFDMEWPLQPPPDWSLFAIRGLPSTSLLLALMVASPLVGDVQEDVVLGVDEDANAVWAVEQRANGRELITTPPDRVAAIRPVEAVGAAQPAYEYKPSIEVPDHWHPYIVQELAGERWLVQGRLADLSTSPAKLRTPPVAELLHDPDAPPSGPAHRLDPWAVPSYGRRLERRWVLGRRTDGRPVLWSQRRHIPLLAPPVNQLRFDVLAELPAP
jgi:hypothetical protein